MANLVVCIAIGYEYQQIAALTLGSVRAYAAKIGAEFLCITEKKIATTTAHWEKCRIVDLLDTYARVLYLDVDLIIRHDCPDLFALVPEDCLGAFVESPFTDRSRELMIAVCKEYGVTLASWDGKYLNSGVIVASRCHQQLFVKPDQEVCSFWEQGWWNMQIALYQPKLYELPYTLNRLSCMDSFTGEHRLASYIVHYAGCPNTQLLLPIIRDDLATWERTRPAYRFTRHLHVVVSGGLGDQVQAEPAIRFMREQVYPDAYIAVSTHFPRLFQHLDVDVYQHGDFQPLPDTPYYTVASFPPPESINWMVLSNLLCHTVDYCSAALLRRILPSADKRVHLDSSPDDLGQLRYHNLDELVVVHAGRHWVTKTFPLSWWQAVVDGLASEGLQVCLIGQDDDTRGVVPVQCPFDGLDLRNRLSLDELIALLKHAPVLLSNDSAPIHLAGAFDNWIILVPSCKEPEHVLPWRHGSVWWHAQALYKRLTLHDVSSRPTDVHGSSADFEVQDWSIYLPDVAEVVQAVADALRGVTYARD